jgi:putative ABC transport system substrate-binding protein
LVQLAPDVLWLHSDPAAWAAKRATTTIPIVVGVAVGLVEQGLVASHARPDGNLTGLELPPIEVAGKRLELFKDAVPTISRVAVLVEPARADHALVPNNIARDAQALGVQRQRVEAGAPAAFAAAFAAMVQGRADALMITESALFAAHRQQLLALALEHRLPTMAYGRHWAEAGSLLAYGADPRALCQRSAVLVHKILHGATPADLPIERAEFQLVVNLKTAEALGVTVPSTFLFRADGA